ncbi:MAG TPA: MBL fold metallo-hydrolase [Candidatus Paceibacterota bacterium]
MIITYHGENFVKVQHGDLVVAWNQNGVNQIKIGGKNPFIIDGPGEYEVSNIFVQGFGVPSSDKTPNTIFLLSFEGLRFVHLGAIGEAKIPESVSAGVGEVDVLFAPLGGPKPLSPAAVYQLALAFQSKVIIPLTESETIRRQFLKEAGAEGVKPIDKLVLKKKDILEKEGEVVVLTTV